jgi:hypothetical protein
MITELITEDGMQVQEYEEILPEGHKHHIILTPATRDRNKDNMQVSVPIGGQNCVYLLG